MVLVGISVGCSMGCFRAPPPWRKTAPLKRPIKRSMTGEIRATLRIDSRQSGRLSREQFRKNVSQTAKWFDSSERISGTGSQELLTKTALDLLATLRAGFFASDCQPLQPSRILLRCAGSSFGVPILYTTPPPHPWKIPSYGWGAYSPPKNLPLGKNGLGWGYISSPWKWS